eukprot:1899201-Amphidinium_carterae.1
MLRVRPEQWPRVRLPAPEREPVVLESAKKAEFPAAPFVIGPHQRVVEHETYAIWPDCERHDGVHTGRSCFNYHALKGRPCIPLKIQQKNVQVVHSSGSGGMEPALAGVGEVVAIH